MLPRLLILVFIWPFTAAWACEFLLISNRTQDAGVPHFTSTQSSNFELGVDAAGLLIYKATGLPLHTPPGETAVTTWHANGRVYAAVVPDIRADNEIKHSSFSANQPVQGAWMMSVQNGWVREIIDGSGHYEPTPYHMHLAVLKLRRMGLDLSRANLIFNFGMREIRGLKISADRFLFMAKERTPDELSQWRSINAARGHQLKFLNLIAQTTADERTRALIDLHRLRNVKTEPTPEIIGRVAAYFSLREADLIFLLQALFVNDSAPHFPEPQSYFDLPPATRDRVLQKIRAELLKSLAADDRRAFVQDWLSENSKM